MDLAFVEINPLGLIPGLVFFGVLVLALVYLLSQARQGSENAGKTAVANWKEMAVSEQALNKRLTAENAAMAEELQECTEFRDEFALHVVRAAARERKYQEAINDIQRNFGLPLSKWDDVPTTQHAKKNPDRR